MRDEFRPECAPPAEGTEIHTRLLKCALAADESRAYWSRIGESALAGRALVDLAFEQSWFGPKSMPWVEVLIANLRARFDAFPGVLAALARWRDIGPQERGLVCHFHLQLSDPLYRAFTGSYLVERRLGLRAEVRRSSLVRWVFERGAERWTPSTCTQFASRLLSCAAAVGLVTGRKDPRELAFPRVSDRALSYLLYLLRGVRFAGSMVQNPYLASVGLEGPLLADRLRLLDSVRYRRVGDLHDFEWRDPDLASWAEREFGGLAR